MTIWMSTFRGRLQPPCISTPPTRLLKAAHLRRTYSSFLTSHTSTPSNLMSRRLTPAKTTPNPLNRLTSLKRHFTMDQAELKHFLADSPPSTVNLVIKQHFDALKDKEKLYAHYISKASFAGTRIVLRQVSPESENIYDFIIVLYKTFNGDWDAAQRKSGIEHRELQYFLEYAAQFLGNTGNFKSFGDSKILPRAKKESFDALAATSSEAQKFYDATDGAIFSAPDNGKLALGYPPEHISAYYPDSPNITKADIDAVAAFTEEKKLLVENTRLRKTEDGYELLIASGNTSVPVEGGDIGTETEFQIQDGSAKGSKLKLIYGDYKEQMTAIAEYHRKAADVAANDNQKKMHEAYAKSFQDGSMIAHKDSQRFWIRDKQPMVESNIGFIETYRDPHGVRGEWEGFAAVVNLERTRAFSGLVDSAESLIPKLPWGKEFEKDKFLSPDFTSLEVLTFAGSGIPAGINIPNYDDIRQAEGFKNVSLGNVLSAKAPNERIPFIADADLGIYEKYRNPAFEVQVGIHELLGHGCGKLLQEIKKGEYNFDISSPPINPITNKPVTSWYLPGQTWGSVFGSVAGAYEECRAECVAMALSCDFEILKIFGFGDGKEDIDGEAGDVLYAAYLSMARAGIASLEMFNPQSRKWGQPHSQARFSILKCFLEAPDNFCILDYKKDDLSDLTIKLDRSKITTIGRKAVEDYLQKLHIYKATADFKAGNDFFGKMTHVDEDFWGKKVRDEVLRVKQPRKVFVQANTYLRDDGSVELVEYEPSLEGMIKSYAERDV